MSFRIHALQSLRQPAPRSFKFFRLISLAGAFAFSVPGIAAEASLTLPDAQRHAIEQSRRLSAHDYAITALRDSAIAAGQLPDPVVNLAIDNLPLDGRDRYSLTGDFMTMRRIGVMQVVTRSDKRQLRTERLDLTAEKTLAEKAETTAAIQRDAALAWLERYYAEAMVAVIAKHGEQAKLEIEAADSAYRAGRGTQAEVFSARNALAVFADRASEMQRRVRNAKIMLARWIGEAAEMPLAVKPDNNRIRLDLATLDHTIHFHPRISVLSKQQEIAETEARLAQADKNADWTMEVAYSQRGPAFSNMLSFGVAIPLQWDQKNRQNREVSSKLALVEQAKAERDDVLRGHIAQARAMIIEWQNARERHARYERELLLMAYARTQSMLTAYSGNRVSLAEVLAARRNEIDVRIQALTLEAEADRLWAQINFMFPDNGAEFRFGGAGPSGELSGGTLAPATRVPDATPDKNKLPLRAVPKKEGRDDAEHGQYRITEVFMSRDTDASSTQSLSQREKGTHEAQQKGVDVTLPPGEGARVRGIDGAGPNVTNNAIVINAPAEGALTDTSTVTPEVTE